MNRHQFPFDTNRGLAVIVFFSVLTTVGCSGGNPGALVDGTVTLDGKTIGPGVVIFAPLGGKENPAIGTIQPDGSYSVKTGGKPGLPVGTYRVCVQVYEQSPDRKPGERTMTPSKSIVPKKFASVETSGLQYDVSSGRNTIDISLASQ